LRASKDVVQRSACGHPSRRARNSAHLRMTLSFAGIRIDFAAGANHTMLCPAPFTPHGISDFQKLSLTPDPNQLLIRRHPVPREGALAIVTDVGAGSSGRGCAFDERRVTRTAKSCGPDAPMAGVKFLGSSRFLGMTVTNKLWSRRGEHGISRKPLRREGRTASAEPVCSCAFFYLPLHMRPRVQRAPGLPCALFFSEGERILQTSGECCRENAQVCSQLEG
jgi:hypothetical protein